MIAIIEHTGYCRTLRVIMVTPTIPHLERLVCVKLSDMVALGFYRKQEKSLCIYRSRRRVEIIFHLSVTSPVSGRRVLPIDMTFPSTMDRALNFFLIQWELYFVECAPL